MRFKRPPWNKTVKVNLAVTECFLDACKEAAGKLNYINEQEFIVSVVREKLKELGVVRFREPPRGEVQV